MALLQPDDVPSRQGINDAITSEIANLSADGGPLYDTGWVPVPVGSGFEAYPGRPPKVRRIGAMVNFRGGFRASGGGGLPASDSATLALGEIPAGFVPTELVGLALMSGNTAASGGQRGWIDSGGGVRAGIHTATPYVMYNATWFIN